MKRRQRIIPCPIRARFLQHARHCMPATVVFVAFAAILWAFMRLFPSVRLLIMKCGPSLAASSADIGSSDTVSVANSWRPRIGCRGAASRSCDDGRSVSHGPVRTRKDYMKSKTVHTTAIVDMLFLTLSRTWNRIARGLFLSPGHDNFVEWLARLTLHTHYNKAQYPKSAL